MFEATRLTFYYTLRPVHMGAGSAIGAIDNPIQREVHTAHPMFSGAGIKGALRHHFNHTWSRVDGKPNDLIARIFGPDTNSSDFAGALSLSDAQLVALPVRSLKNAYAYVTCPLALARLKRLATFARVQVEWEIPSVPGDEALTSTANLLANGRLVLEAFEFAAKPDDIVKKVAAWLSQHVIDDKFFREKLESDFIVLTDDDFTHFARHAMVVEPHVRIDDESGTADDGGLFYTENLPPESIMVGLAQASMERSKKGDKRNKPMNAEDILETVFDGSGNQSGISSRILQIGGDATKGRGLVVVKPIAKAATA